MINKWLFYWYTLPAVVPRSTDDLALQNVGNSVRSALEITPSARRKAMRKAQSLFVVLCLVASVLLTACTTYRATPVDPRSVGTLKPSIEDPDAGLVGMEPGFDLKRYQVIVVELFQVTPSEIKNEDDIRLAKEFSAYLQAQLVGRLRSDPSLPRVVDATETTERPTGEGALALQGEISRLTGGSQELRYLVGFGAGTAKTQVETRLVDTRSGRTELITVDRRTASGGLFGGDSRKFLNEFVERIAESFATFLHRLATGGQPGRR